VPRYLMAILVAFIASLGMAQSAQAWPNGGAPESALSPIGNCGVLTNKAAAAWNTLQLYVREDLPPNGCASTYRKVGRPSDFESGVFGTQWYFRSFWCAQGKCGNAAPPGTSNHGWGLAIDVPQYVRNMVDRFGARFGWCKCWSDAAHEWWHLKFNDYQWKNRPDPGTNLRSPILRRGSGGPGQGRYVRFARQWIKRHGQPRTRTKSQWYTREFASRVSTFQRRHNMKADGVIGPRTWSKLRNRREIRRNH